MPHFINLHNRRCLYEKKQANKTPQQKPLFKKREKQCLQCGSAAVHQAMQYAQ